MSWESKKEAVICISTRLLSTEPLFLYRLDECRRFREDAILIERKPMTHQVRITYFKSHENFLFENRGALFKKKKKKVSTAKPPTHLIILFLTLFTPHERISLFSHCGIALHNTGFHKI